MADERDGSLSDRLRVADVAVNDTIEGESRCSWACLPQNGRQRLSALNQSAANGVLHLSNGGVDAMRHGQDRGEVGGGVGNGRHGGGGSGSRMRSKGTQPQAGGRLGGRYIRSEAQQPVGIHGDGGSIGSDAGRTRSGQNGRSADVSQRDWAAG